MAGQPLSDALQRRIRAGMLRVHSKRLASTKLWDCLNDAYDECAGAFDEAGEALTDELLTERVPAMVFDAALEHKWGLNPWHRPRGRAIVGSFLTGGYNPARYEQVPQLELTETFGGHKVTKGYRKSFNRKLGSRIAYWQAKALTRAEGGGLSKPEPADAPQPEVAAHTDNSSVNNTRAQVDAFIERVFEAKGRRITRIDIWRVAGYIEATQFQRFQRNKGASAGSIAKFTKILKLEPPEFLERLDRMSRAK
jgi:hypothetical protein